MTKKTLLLMAALCVMAGLAAAQVDARLLRQPDVSATHIAFVYAGDIWIVPKTGGVAQRLSSPAGEEMLPRFSPDGRHIAYSANYDGNTDVYVIPVMGGTPTRVTYHPLDDRMVDWRPSGQGLLFASARESGRQRFNQFYSVAATGGLPDKLPVPYGEFGALSPDEKILAYMPQSRDFRNWKRYRGGWASEIWLFNLETLESENITRSDAVDGHPMWYGRTLYFLSDRGPNQRPNIWKYSLDSKAYTQVTRFTDFDVTLPAMGPSDIVFEAVGALYLLDLTTEKYREVKVDVVTDLATLRPRLVKAGSGVESATVSPSGKRAVFEARGEIFSVPAEHGVVLNLTQRPGSAERYPAWSPDGKHLAYWSDASGEYELMLRPADGSGEARQVTNLGPGFRYTLYWSPDSGKIAFIDHAHVIRLLDVETSALTEVDTLDWMLHPSLGSFEVQWSADGRWLAYDKTIANYHSAVFMYDTKEQKRHQVTSGYYNDHHPTFDPEGNYLYFLTDRDLTPVYGGLDATWIYPNNTCIAAAALRADVPSPLAPRNDTEPVKEEKPDQKDKAEDGKDKKAEAEEAPAGEDEETAAEETAAPPDPKEAVAKKDEAAGKEKQTLAIELDGLEKRVVLLPPDRGNYTDLRALKGQVLYRKLPFAGSADRTTPIMAYDLKERKEMPILDDADGFVIAAGGKKMLVAQRRAFYIVDIRPKQKLTDRLNTGDMAMMMDPRAEWRQIYTDVWRRYRDMFYDPTLHGLDWAAMRDRYGALLDDAVTRWDINHIIGNLIAEISSSHTYVGGGDVESPARESVGLLGIDWALENGAYRVARIVDGAPWDSEVRSPLRLPGVDVKEGDYILAVNGIPLDTARDPWAAFQGLAGKTVVLRVNDKPSAEGARDVLVETMAGEGRLRHLEWIEANRRRVDKASGGRVGYVYMPDTGGGGQTELIRQYYSQIDKDGFVIDERFNSGGQLADRFVELLGRPIVHYLAWRYGAPVQQPRMANPGPKVMLINGWSVSGGDAFPYTFKDQKIGPIVGTRTAGGLIGPAVGHRTIDGGFYTVPEGRIYGNDGRWFPEGIGVAPDIEVVDDPSQLARGTDPQLERAVTEVMRLLEQNSPREVPPPPFEDRTAAGSK